MKCVYIPRDVPECGKQYLRERGCELRMGSRYDEETMRREIVGADAVLARTAPFTRSVIEAAGKQLKIIARFGVGYESIDVDAATENGVYVTIAKNANMRAVAEHTFALILAICKGILPKFEACKNGDWEIRNRVVNTEIFQKTIGIIGLGNIGREVAAIAANGFGMNVLACDAYVPAQSVDKYVKMVDLDELLERSDVVTVHVPVTPETKNLINAAALAKMKRDAILINVDRGGIVNEDDLYDALTQGVIAACGTDTFAAEPVSPDHKLLRLPNFIASPHCGGLTREASDLMCMLAAESIHDVLCGRAPKYPVNAPKLG